MNDSLVVEVIIILALIAANGFFALSEFSVIASRKARLRQKVMEKKFGADIAARLHENPEGFLATIQVGITLVGALVGVASGATVVEKLTARLAHSSIHFIADSAEPIAFVTTVVAITILTVILGELVPKYIALSYPERYARLVAWPMNLFYRVTFVFAMGLSSIARIVVRLLGIRKNVSREVLSEEEIEHILMEGREKGLFEVAEERFIKRVFAFTDATVRRAMRPRTDVVALDVTTPVEEVRRLVAEHGYSRYPVFERTLDHVVGVLYTKDLLSGKGLSPGQELRQLVREPMFVPDSLPLPRLLGEFQRGKNHLAVVLDEFGGTAGIITLEDILEELVGEIQDEYDAETAAVVRVGDTVVHADAGVSPLAVNELIRTHLPDEEERTLAGLFIDELGRVPERYEHVDIANARLTVLAKDKNRITRLKIERVEPELPPD